MPKAPSVIELTDLPHCDPNVSRARVISVGETVNVVYEAQGKGWPDTETYAVVRFEDCTHFECGSPNDEALHNHPCFKFGLKWYALQEIVGSPKLSEWARIGDKDGRTKDERLLHHYFFALKEDSFECMARSYRLVGLFHNIDDAIDAAINE